MQLVCNSCENDLISYIDLKEYVVLNSVYIVRTIELLIFPSVGSCT